MNFDTFVFVYGSLKRGFDNHFFMRDAEFLMTALTAAQFDMVSFDYYPAVVKKPCSNGYFIEGELYNISPRSLLGDLDPLESNGYFFQRERINVRNFDFPVWMYFLLYPNQYETTDEGVGVRDNNIKFWEKRACF